MSGSCVKRRHRRKSLPLAVNKDACDRRRKGEHDQKAAEYHSQTFELDPSVIMKAPPKARAFGGSKTIWKTAAA
jgi:hypothetical protein